MVLASGGAARADADYDACVGATTTNAGYSTCGSALIDRENARLNAAWRNLTAGADAKTRAALLTEQRLWNAYKEKSCLFYADGSFGREGVVIHFPACRAEVISKRTAELEAFAAFLAQH